MLYNIEYMSPDGYYRWLKLKGENEEEVKRKFEKILPKGSITKIIIIPIEED